MSREYMFRVVSESTLANVIAFKEAEVPSKDLTRTVGRKGGTIVGRGVVFQTPIEERLSEYDARELIKRYGKLVSEYSKGRLDHGLLDNFKLRNASLQRPA